MNLNPSQFAIITIIDLRDVALACEAECLKSEDDDKAQVYARMSLKMWNSCLRMTCNLPPEEMQ